MQDTLRRIDKTFNRFFSRIKKKEKAGYPRFKGQNKYDSFCYPQRSFWLRNNKLELGKIGKIKIKLSRSVIGKVKNCTIKREADKWFVIFSVETTLEPLPKTGKEIGIDVGIENFATFSDGTQIENSKFYQSSQKKLRVAQRAVARKIKGSKSRKKAVLKIKKIYLKITNQRRDFQHKLSTRIVKEFDLIVIEKLNILGLAKGILSKQVSDVAWGGFFNMLRYKAESADKKLIEVNSKGTSQTCICGEIVKKNLNVRIHNCESCGLSEHRDIVSAKVILKLGLGHSLLAQTKVGGL